MIYVVPSLKAKEKLQSEGKAWAESQGFTYVPRGKRTIQDLMDEYGEDFLVYSSRGPQIDRPEGSHFFSLNMAELRIRNLRKGQRDHLLEALMGRGSSKPPITVLDCTCGFGADAAVASFGLPAGSRVDALEVSPLLEAVTSWGFSHFVHKKDDVTAALRRISLRRGDYRDYLLSDEGPVYDVLYFDPMFQRPVEASCQFQPVRAIMEHGGLTRDLIERALQKAGAGSSSRSGISANSAAISRRLPYMAANTAALAMPYWSVIHGKVMAIIGPTAVGKTALSFALAEHYGTDLISGDAYQIYRHMDIGTAKPTADELSRYHHYLIDIAEPDEPYSAARFCDMAGKAIAEVNGKGKVPIVVGGTGLYVQSLLEGYDFQTAA